MMNYVFEEIAADRANEFIKNFNDFNNLIENQKPKVLERMLTELSNLFKGHRNNSTWKKARKILQERINTNKIENKESIKDSRQKNKLKNGESIDYKNKTIYNESGKDFQLDAYLSKQIDDKFIIGKRTNATLLSEKYVYDCTHEGNEITIVNAITLNNYEKFLKEIKDGRNNIRGKEFDTRVSANEFIRGRRNVGINESNALQSRRETNTEIENDGERSRTDSGSNNRNDENIVKDTRYKIDASTEEFLNATTVEDFNKLLSQAESLGDHQVIKQRVLSKFKETRNRAYSRFIQTGRYVSLENYINTIDESAIDNAFDKCKDLEGVRYYEEFNNDVRFGETAISIRNSSTDLGERQKKSRGNDVNSQSSERGRGLYASGGDVDTKQRHQQSSKSVLGDDVYGNTQLETNPATRVEKITKIIKSNTIRKTKSI